MLYGRLAVDTTVSCIRNWIPNIKLLCGLDAGPWLTPWAGPVGLCNEVLQTAKSTINSISLMDGTLQGVALARRRHIVWYATFSALDPHEAVGPGLNMGPSCSDYVAGNFFMEGLSQEIVPVQSDSSPDLCSHATLRGQSPPRRPGQPDKRRWRLPCSRRPCQHPRPAPPAQSPTLSPVR